jgi:FkbM family methyltransferase
MRSSGVVDEVMQPLRCSVAHNPHGAYCVPESSQHRAAARAILAGKVYEPNTIAFIQSHCRDGDIVHAGTYFGDFLPPLAGACQGTVWAFEPGGENFRCAQITLRLNDLRNVRLVRAGLGASPGELPLVVADADGLACGGSSSFVSRRNTPGVQMEVVPVVAIDVAVPADRHVSVIQLDVEGFEQEALIGALATIARCRPALVVEILPDSPLRTSDWIPRNIFSRGYRLAGAIDGNAVYLPD